MPRPVMDALQQWSVGDVPRVSAARGRLAGWFAQQWSPVTAGRALLLSTGSVMTLTVPMLRPDRGAWAVLAAVTTTTTLLLLLSAVLPWSRLPRRCTLLFPVSVWVGVAVLAVGTHGLAPAYVGVFVLGFAYVGLTQPPGTSLWLVPLAATADVEALGAWSATLTVRLLIAVAVWVLLAELLAELTGRQQTMTEVLHRAAHTDVLTGLANRRDLELRLAASRPGDTVVICDLDHFKQLNDTVGHLAGDRVLAEFGLCLRACLREKDYAARYGGEEFALLLTATSITQARAVLSRLRESWCLLQPDVAFSAGLATHLDDLSPQATLAAADLALYAAKAAGRNCDRTAPAATPARTGR